MEGGGPSPKTAERIEYLRVLEHRNRVRKKVASKVASTARGDGARIRVALWGRERRADEAARVAGRGSRGRSAASHVGEEKHGRGGGAGLGTAGGIASAAGGRTCPSVARRDSGRRRCAGSAGRGDYAARRQATPALTRCGDSDRRRRRGVSRVCGERETSEANSHAPHP